MMVYIPRLQSICQNFLRLCRCSKRNLQKGVVIKVEPKVTGLVVDLNSRKLN
jgi:hypothetical protein